MIATGLNTNANLVKLFIDSEQELISEFQIHESLRVRERIYEKMEFDFRVIDEDFSEQDVEDELARSIYFVTIQFKPETHYAKFGKIKQLAQAKAIASLYSGLSNHFIDHAFARNSRLLPFLQLFLDAQGTRYARFIDEIRIPHYHGLFQLNPKTVARFDEWLFEHGKATTEDGKPAIQLTARHLHPIDTITFRKFAPSDGTMENMISYVTKFARIESFWKANPENLELSIFHPQLPKRTYPFYGRMTNPIFTEEDFISFEKDNYFI
jgi:hypothetical protein